MIGGSDGFPLLRVNRTSFLRRGSDENDPLRTTTQLPHIQQTIIWVLNSDIARAKN